MEFLLLVPFLVVSYLLWQEKRETRLREDAWRLERGGLLSRIQAPERVPITEVSELSDEPLYVPYDDDVAHDNYMEAREAGEIQ